MDVDMEREMLESYAPRRQRPEDQVNNVLLAEARSLGLKTWAVLGEPGFWYVQKGTGGENHKVQIVDDRAAHCTCPSWKYRAFCKHSAAVLRRLGIEIF